MFEKLTIFFEPPGPEVGGEVLSPEAEADAKIDEAFGDSAEELSANEQTEVMKKEGIVYRRGEIKAKTGDVMQVLNTMHPAGKLERSWVADALNDSAHDFSREMDKQPGGIFRKTYEIPIGVNTSDEDVYQSITLKYDPDKASQPVDLRYSLHFGESE